MILLDLISLIWDIDITLHEMDAMTYKIVRYYADHSKSRRTIETGLTLDEAHEHCNDPQSCSKTGTNKAALQTTRRNGDWFDGYTAE